MEFQVEHPASLVAGCGILAPVNASVLEGPTHTVPLNMSLITKYDQDLEYGLLHDDEEDGYCMVMNFLQPGFLLVRPYPCRSF